MEWPNNNMSVQHNQEVCSAIKLNEIHTLRVHYAHTAANLNSGYSKYAKVARVHYFLYNCTPNISRSADVSVSVA